MTPVDVITLRRIHSTIRRSTTSIAEVAAEVSAEPIEAVAQVEAVKAVEKVKFDAVEEFAVSFSRTVRYINDFWGRVLYPAFILHDII